MSKSAIRFCLSSVLFVRVHGNNVASATAQASGLTSIISAILDDPVGEALGEAFCTACFFVSIWACGKSLGWKFGSKDAKKTSKSGLGGQASSRTVPVTKSPNQAASRSKIKTFELRTDDEQATPVAHAATAQPRGPPRQGRRSSSGSNTLAETDLLASAVRAGKAAELPRRIDASIARLSKDTSEPEHELMEYLFVACLRACAAKGFFSEMLVLYVHVQGRIQKACCSTWSLLLWSAVEASRFELCSLFLERLLDLGVPTSNDFVNIVRYYVHCDDPAGFAGMLERLQARGCQADVFARNRALALCMNSRAFDLAQKIADSVPNVPMDAIAYNTLMKGFANVGDLANCFGKYGEMRRAQIMPNEMTFGILLDACIDDKQMDYARRVFSDLRESGLSLNVILYTTFIKGLVNAGELDEAMEILDEMCAKSTAKPDLVTFSTLVKAHASVGNVVDCARLLDRMVKMGINPDSVLFNTILTGCSCKAMDPAQVLHVFSWLVNKGLQPSTATLSVLVKAFSLSKSWSHALDVLEAAPARYRVWPEARVYGQLAQSCAKENCGNDAIAAYIAMVRAAGKQGITVNSSHNSRLQRLCSQCGQGARAMRIFQALVDSEGRVDQRVRDVLAAAA